MTSCPRTPHLRSPRFHSAVEVAVELAHLALVVHRDLPDLRVTPVPLALLDLRVMLVNVDPPDQKAPEVFRVPLDQLVVELEEPRYLAPKDLEDLLVPLDLRAITDFLAQPEQTVNLDQRVTPGRRAPLDPPGLRVLLDLLDLQESAAPPVRMQLLLSSIGISPRMRRPRPTARRLTSKTHSDRRTHSRTELGTTLR